MRSVPSRATSGALRAFAFPHCHRSLTHRADGHAPFRIWYPWISATISAEIAFSGWPTRPSNSTYSNGLSSGKCLTGPPQFSSHRIPSLASGMRALPTPRPARRPMPCGWSLPDGARASLWHTYTRRSSPTGCSPLAVVALTHISNVALFFGSFTICVDTSKPVEPLSMRDTSSTVTSSSLTDVTQEQSGSPVLPLCHPPSFCASHFRPSVLFIMLLVQPVLPPSGHITLA